MTSLERLMAMGNNVSAALFAKANSMPRNSNDEIDAADYVLSKAKLHAEGAASIMKGFTNG